MKLQPRREFFKSWITPVIISVALPVHAEVTAPPPEPNILFRDLKLGIQLQSCTSSVVTIRICNNEPFDVTITGAHVEEYPYHTGSWLLILKASSHNTPFVVPKGECIITSFSRQSNRGYWCGPPWRLYVGGGSQGAYGEYDSVRGGAYLSLRDGDVTATSTPFTI